MRVLLTCQPGAGHWRPLVPLAQALVGAGHEVAFATAPVACAAIEANGFSGFSVGTDADEGDGESPLLGCARERADPAQAATVWSERFAGTRARRALPDLLALTRGWRPDVLVRDNTEFAGLVAAEALGIPHAAVQLTAWRPHLHPLVAPPLDRLRAAVGLPPDPATAALSRYLLLDPAPTRWRDPRDPLPPTAHPIRPVASDPPDAKELPPWADGLLAGRPVVYATLGTAYNRTPGVLETILAGLRDEPITLIVTTGPDRVPAALGSQPPNVHIERYLPHGLLFPHLDLVVTHGGSGTVMAALAHGLPLVVVPIAADQPDNAHRCEELGVGCVVAPRERSPEAIRAAVRAVLGEPSYRRRTRRLRAEIEALSGPEHAVALLERLAAERRPLIAVSG